MRTFLGRSWSRRERRALRGFLRRLGVVGLMLVLGIVQARAATIPVAAGAVDVLNGDGICSLTEAVENANAGGQVHPDCVGGDAAGGNTIVLAANSTYTLTKSLSGSGVPHITSQVTIQGNGSTITRDPKAPSFAILAISPGGNLVIDHATINGGYGGITNNGTFTGSQLTISGNLYGGRGGGLNNQRGGTATLDGCSITGNLAGGGGGVFNSGQLTMTNCTVSGNSAPADSGGGIESLGRATLVHCTITGNTGVNANSYNGTGGGIVAANFPGTGSYVKVIGSVVSGNGPPGFAGGRGGAEFGNFFVNEPLNVIDLYNVWGRAGLNDLQAFGDQEPSGTFRPGPTSINATSDGSNIALDAILDSTLKLNAPGTTQTHALVLGSPAIDLGGPNCPATDQRGVMRPQDGNADGIASCDAGAYELVGPVCIDPYRPLPPLRILDTVAGLGAPVGSVAPQHTLPVAVVGVGGVPATGVSAVVVDVTAANATGNGNLRVYPSDLTTPPLVSNVNFHAGEITPNLVIAKVGTDGDVKIFNGSGASTVDVFGDVQGYFVDPSVSYGPLSPVRILDTRSGTGGVTGPIAPGQTVTLHVLGAGGIPATGVSAVALNVTAADGTGNGNLRIFPSDDTSPPLVSNLNFQASTNRANLVIVKVGGDGAIKIYNGSPTATVQAVADTQGWFSSASSCYGPQSPSRILDTRLGQGGTIGPIGAGQTFMMQVAGVGGVPATGIGTVALNVTATNGTGAGDLRVFPSDQITPPPVSNVSFRAGMNVPNLVIVKLGPDGAVKIYNGSPTASVDVVADVQGSFAK